MNTILLEYTNLCCLFIGAHIACLDLKCLRMLMNTDVCPGRGCKYQDKESTKFENFISIFLTYLTLLTTVILHYMQIMLQ